MELLNPELMLQNGVINIHEYTQMVGDNIQVMHGNIIRSEITHGNGILDQIEPDETWYSDFKTRDVGSILKDLYNTPFPKIKQKIMDDKIKLEVEYTKKSTSYGHDRTYRIKDARGDSSFRLDAISYPECCGVVIFKNASINEVAPNTFRNWMDLIIADLNANDRYSKILFYTSQETRMANLMATYPECIVLDKFKNRRSGNMLVGFEINLLDSTKKDSYELEEEDEDEVSMFEEEEDEEDDNVVPVLSYPDPPQRSIFNRANHYPLTPGHSYYNNDDLLESGDNR